MTIPNIQCSLCNLAKVLIAYALLMATPSHHGLAGQCLHIEGTLDYTRAPIGSRGQNKESFLFKLTTQERVWNIQMTPVDADKRPIKYCEIGCDGETIYAYSEQNENVVKNKSTNNVPIKLGANGFAMVIPDNVPNPMYFRSEALWLAFCSTWYFSTNTLKKARQIWPTSAVSTSPALTSIMVKASWEWLPKGKHYLAQINFVPKSPSPKEEDYPLVVYRTLRTKDVDNMEVPTEFEYIRFNEINRQKKTPFETYYCQVTKAYHGPGLEDPKPKLPMPVVMMDYRFSQENPAVPLVRQIVTNGAWQEKDEAVVSKQFKIQKRIALIEASNRTPSSSRIIIIGFIVANALVFGFVMIKHRNKKTKTMN